MKTFALQEIWFDRNINVRNQQRVVEMLVNLQPNEPPVFHFSLFDRQFSEPKNIKHVVLNHTRHFQDSPTLIMPKDADQFSNPRILDLHFLQIFNY